MINITTVGDSVTQAESGRDSYRADLWDLLIDAGYDIDFVGSENKTKDNTDFPDSSFDPDHEGHWGWRTDEINNGRSGEGSLSDWLTGYTPDIALIHLGTNDLFQNQSAESTIDDLSETINILRQDNPDVVIFVAELIPTTDSVRNQRIDEFNAQLPALIAGENQSNSPVILVDQNSGFDASQDTYDGIHPNVGGEAKMAQRWFGAIDDYLVANPITPPPAATGEIGNFVFFDEDEDGRQDAGEDFGVVDVTVTLTGAGADSVLGTGDDTTETQVTDTTGAYRFTDLAAGDYTVTFSDLPEGFVFTTANVGGDDTIDSDADPSTGMTSVITLVEDELNLTVDAGVFELFTPGPGGENLIEGSPDNDDLVGTDGDDRLVGFVGIDRLTGGAGNDVFVLGDETGSFYDVKEFQDFAKITDFTVGEDTILLTGTLADHSFLVEGGNTWIFKDGDFVANVFNTGGQDITNDLEFLGDGTPPPVGTGEIGNFVFFDQDEDGEQDAGEDFGVADVTVTLIGAGTDGVMGTADDTTATQVTDANGEYQFTDLLAGDYQLAFSGLPQGFGFTTYTGGFDSATDSDVDPATGRTQVITLAAGESNLQQDAGITELPVTLPRGLLTGVIFPDLDDDGFQDSGEFLQPSTGINLTVTLTGAGADGVFDTADDTIVTQVTDSSGRYEFRTLSAGDYTLTFSDLPEGYRFSPANVGSDDTRDSDVDPTTGVTSVITLAEDEVIQNVYAGIYEFFTPEPGGENLIEGSPNNDELVGTDGDDRLVGFVGIDRLTGGAGNDVFVLGDEAGSFYDVKEFQDFAKITDFTVGEDTILLTGTLADHSFVTDSGNTWIFKNGDFVANVFNTAGQDLTNSLEFLGGGSPPPPASTGEIGNFVFFDEDEDGRQDAEEDFGVVDVTVTLTGAGADSVLGTGDDTTETQVTDTTGAYRFTDLAAGDYTVTFSDLPEGFVFTTANVGGDDTIDSDADPSTGMTSVITLVEDELNLTVDAGVFELFTPGPGGENLIEGSPDNDDLVGTDGDDRLVGFVGIDRLTGGAGNDVFVLGDETGSFYDVKEFQDFAKIIDFTLGEDTILLTGSLADHSFLTENGNTWIFKDGDFVANVFNTAGQDLTSSLEFIG